MQATSLAKSLKRHMIMEVGATGLAADSKTFRHQVSPCRTSPVLPFGDYLHLRAC